MDECSIIVMNSVKWELGWWAIGDIGGIAVTFNYDSKLNGYYFSMYQEGNLAYMMTMSYLED